MKITRKQVERTLRVWQTRLGLQTWDIKIDWEKSAGDDINASTYRLNTYDRATLCFDTAYVNWSKEFLNQTVVHELLHLVTRDLDRVFADFEISAHPEAYRVLDKRYDHEIEGVVDRLANRIVEIGGCV
jgi:hypothetical protein